MPFKSKAQQRWMFAKHPEMAHEWAEHTPDMKALPEKKKAVIEKKAAEDLRRLLKISNATPGTGMLAAAGNAFKAMDPGHQMMLGGALAGGLAGGLKGAIDPNSTVLGGAAAGAGTGMALGYGAHLGGMTPGHVSQGVQTAHNNLMGGPAPTAPAAPEPAGPQHQFPPFEMNAP